MQCDRLPKWPCNFSRDYKLAIVQRQNKQGGASREGARGMSTLSVKNAYPIMCICLLWKLRGTSGRLTRSKVDVCAKSHPLTGPGPQRETLCDIPPWHTSLLWLPWSLPSFASPSRSSRSSREETLFFFSSLLSFEAACVILSRLWTASLYRVQPKSKAQRMSGRLWERN